MSLCVAVALECSKMACLVPLSCHPVNLHPLLVMVCSRLLPSCSPSVVVFSRLSCARSLVRTLSLAHPLSCAHSLLHTLSRAHALSCAPSLVRTLSAVHALPCTLSLLLLSFFFLFHSDTRTRTDTTSMHTAQAQQVCARHNNYAHRQLVQTQQVCARHTHSHRHNNYAHRQHLLQWNADAA